MKNNYKTIITVICVAIFFGISVFFRIPNEEKEKYDNIDATYHTLLTMKCYEETPIYVHKFLPIVSLGSEDDKNISWGACVSDEVGNYYYTSFSPAGFVAPYLFVKLFNLPINIYSLYVYNTILLIATIVVMAVIFCKLFKKYINKNLIIFLTALIYLFQIEVMHSQGVIYWVHSLSQLLIGVQFLLFLNYENKKCKTAFYIMCLCMPYIEWTGYISNFAFGVVLFIKDIVDNKKITIKSFTKPICIGIITIVSFILFSAHFLLNINWDAYINAIMGRFFARNVTSSIVGFKELFEGYYIRSYRNILVFILVMTGIVLIIKKYRKKIVELIKEYKYPIIFFILIMLENVVMLQHAVEYTFDRLKLMYIIITYFFIIFIAVYSENKKNQKMNHIFTIVMIMILLVISVVNVKQYNDGYGLYITQNMAEINNQSYAKYINENYNKDNSVVCSSNSIRGYMNMLLRRGIYEHKTFEDAKKIAENKDKEYLIYINAIDYVSIGNISIYNTKTGEEYLIDIKEGELQNNKIYN